MAASSNTAGEEVTRAAGRNDGGAGSNDGRSKAVAASTVGSAGAVVAAAIADAVELQRAR